MWWQDILKYFSSDMTDFLYFEDGATNSNSFRDSPWTTAWSVKLEYLKFGVVWKYGLRTVALFENTFSEQWRAMKVWSPNSCIVWKYGLRTVALFKNNVSEQWRCLKIRSHISGFVRKYGLRTSGLFENTVSEQWRCLKIRSQAGGGGGRRHV